MPAFGCRGEFMTVETLISRRGSLRLLLRAATDT
jgi:hypothetical protein